MSSALGFDACWARAGQVPGWLTRDQARTLWEAATAAPEGGWLLEIGSHQGRSTIVLGEAARRRGATVLAVDPHEAGGMFGGPATRETFLANLEAAGLAEVVQLVPRKSTELRRDWRQPLDLLFVDGKHDYWTATDDLRWSEFLPDGAPVFVHDAFSSIGVTLALLVHVLPGHRLRYVVRVGSLARFEVGTPTVADRLNLAAQLPWFVRNVVIKIALRIGRAFGHRRPDPY